MNGENADFSDNCDDIGWRVMEELSFQVRNQTPAMNWVMMALVEIWLE